MARKPRPPQLLALSGLNCQLASGGQPVNAMSPFWRPLLRAGWLTAEGRLSEAGSEAIERYRTTMLICRHCESHISDYVADRTKTKQLRRQCRICGSERQLFVVDGARYEVVGQNDPAPGTS